MVNIWLIYGYYMVIIRLFDGDYMVIKFLFNGKFPFNKFWHMIFAYICTRIWQNLRRLGGIAVAI
jgi:hypothetical protein